MRARPRLPGDRPRHVPAAALAAARRTLPGNPPAPRAGRSGRCACGLATAPAGDPPSPAPAPAAPLAAPVRLQGFPELERRGRTVGRGFPARAGEVPRNESARGGGRGRLLSPRPLPGPGLGVLSWDSRQRRRGRGVQLGVPVIDRDGSLSHLSSLRTQAGVQPLPGGGEGDPREELSGRHFWGQLWPGGRAEQRPQAQRQVGGWGRPSLSCPAGPWLGGGAV